MNRYQLYLRNDEDKVDIDSCFPISAEDLSQHKAVMDSIREKFSKNIKEEIDHLISLAKEKSEVKGS